MNITQEKVGGAVVLTLAGHLNSATSASAEQVVVKLIDGGTKALAIDLAAVDYISSAGLRVLLIAAKRMKAGNGKLCLAGLQPKVKEIFDISGFTGLFTLTPTRAAALAKLG